MMRSEKESHVLRESPAYSVCRSDFMAQFLPDSKCLQKNTRSCSPKLFFICSSYYQGTQFVHNHVCC